MRSHIHHAALKVADLDWYTKFFQDVFGMTYQKSSGERPARKLWFNEGIQLIEVDAESSHTGHFDHIAIAVDDIPGIVEASINMGCSRLPDGENWIALPNGARLELMHL